MPRWQEWQRLHARATELCLAGDNYDCRYSDDYDCR
jgi:hypothetical protein